MKGKVHIAFQNMGDGSIRTIICPTRQVALDRLNSTEEQQEEGVPYEYGHIEEVEMEFNAFGELVQAPITVDVDGIG